MPGAFWDKVEKCNHENLSSDYLQTFRCETPQCTGSEVHCLDCGVYLSDCGCHYNQGMSGWPRQRELGYNRKEIKG